MIVDGIAKAHFLAGSPRRQCCRRIVLAGSRVKHVCPGCGGGLSFWSAPIQGTEKGRSHAERPNIIIVSQPKSYVNIHRRKSGDFCVLYHFCGSYLCEIPSCKGGWNVVGCWYRKKVIPHMVLTPAGWAASSVYHKCQSQCKLKKQECIGRDSNKTKARLIQQKARLSNDRTQD